MLERADRSFRRAERLDGLELSEIVVLTEAAKRLRAAGADIVALGTGEPDFPTPEHANEAARQAMRAGDTRYPPTAGTAALRAAVAEHAAGPACAAENVVITNGAKQALSNLFTATLNPGDEVIIPAPFWTSYADIVAVAGGRARIVPCGGEVGFKLTPQMLEGALGPRTRWLLLNTPNNPTGALYTAHELAELAEVLRQRPDVWIASDEIYAHISYGAFASFRAAAPDLAERTAIINGVSKAYAMTGWRVGWAIGPKPLIDAMVAVQGQSTSGACSIAQAAALGALTGPQGLLAERREAFRARRDFVVSALNEAPHLDCATPDGAFYVFPSCAAAIGRRTAAGDMIEDDAAFCRYLLDAGVAVVPGRAFGLPGHFRLSYAYGVEDLREGCARIATACAALT